MGAVYDVNMTVNVTDESAAIAAMNAYINEHDEKTCVFDDKQDRTTLDGLIKTFITDRGYSKEPQKDGFISYQTGFEASYGWESVMMDMFRNIAPYLAEKSTMKIAPDTDYDLLVVNNGKAVQLH